MNLDTAAQAINVQQDIKVAELEQIILHDYVKINKNWSSYPTSTRTTSFGEGLAKKVHDRGFACYAARRIGERTFQCSYVGEERTAQLGDLMDVQFTQEFDDDFSYIPIPRFSRIRQVTVEEDGTMLCDCCRFESTLCFCEHCVAVANLVYASSGEKFNGFGHHDIGARYRSDYMHLAYRESTPKIVKQLFHKLSANGIRGPKLRIIIPDSLPIEEKLPILSAIDRLKNYKKSDINLGLFENMVSHIYAPPTDLDNDAEYDLFNEQIEAFNSSTTAASEARFDISMNNSKLPSSAKGGARTRDILKQQWEEACDMADNIGEEGTRELEECVAAFRSYCNQGQQQTGENDEIGRCKYVPMTQGKYQGSQKRVYNTHHMYRSK